MDRIDGRCDRAGRRAADHDAPDSRPASRIVPAPRAASAAAAAAVLAVLALVVPRPADGQGDPEACRPADGFPFPPPAASPLEPHTRLAAVRVDRGERERWVALADLGERIPFWISRGCPGGDGAPRGTDAPGAAPTTAGAASSAGRPGLQLAGSVAGGAFSRFDLERNGNEMIEVHYRVGLRLRARLRGLEARLEAYHVSSHLGDEFLERTGRNPISTSREGIELLVQTRPAPRLRLYGGPGVLVRSTRDLEAPSLRGGAEWRAATTSWGPFAPYVSVEAFSWQESGWDPTLAGEAGVASGGGRFRLAAVAGSGPSRAEQFVGGAGETLWGLSFSVTW